MSTNPPSFSWVKVQHLSQFLPYNLLGCPCLCRVKSYFSENLTLFTFAGPCHGGENYLRWPRISTLDWRLTASTRPTNSSPLILFASGQPTFSTCHFRRFPLCSTFNPAPYPHNSPAMLSNSLSPYFSEKKWFRWKPQHLLPSNLQATCTCPKLSPCLRREGLTPLF